MKKIFPKIPKKGNFSQIFHLGIMWNIHPCWDNNMDYQNLWFKVPCYLHTMIFSYPKVRPKKMIEGGFPPQTHKEVSRLFWINMSESSSKDNSKVVQGCLRDILRKIQLCLWGCFKEFSIVFLKHSIKSISSLFK